MANSIAGNAGVALAVVNYFGTATGHVTADGAGAYTISGLAAGSYRVEPNLKSHCFQPPVRDVVIVASNIAGVDFVALTPLEVIDSRVVPNNSVTDIGGTDQYTVVPADSRAAGAPADSRASGPEVDSRIAAEIELNSRKL